MMGFQREAREALLVRQTKEGRELSDDEVIETMQSQREFKPWCATQGRRLLQDRIDKAVHEDAMARQKDFFDQLPIDIQDLPPTIARSKEDVFDLENATKADVLWEIGRLEEESRGVLRTANTYRRFIAWRDKTDSWPTGED